MTPRGAAGRRMNRLDASGLPAYGVTNTGGDYLGVMKPCFGWILPQVFLESDTFVPGCA